jgi:DNA-binding MarR family transcriptional regulator
LEFEDLTVHETPSVSPGFLLWHISTSWRSSIEAILKPLDLTHPQFVVLATLGWLTRKGGRVTQNAVGKLACLDPNTTSQIIKGLEVKGLLKRERSADGRAKNPLLTPQGQAILARALPAVETEDGAFFGPLTKKEMEMMIRIFQKLMPQA